MDLRVNTFGLYIKANKESYGLQEQIQVVYIDLMVILLKEYIKWNTKAQSMCMRNNGVGDKSKGL